MDCTGIVVLCTAEITPLDHWEEALKSPADLRTIEPLWGHATTATAPLVSTDGHKFETLHNMAMDQAEEAEYSSS